MNNSTPKLQNLSTQAIFVLDDTTIIGRHEDCNLVLRSERGASRKHARITLENNIAVLMDLGSLNGTLVNGREISRAVQLVDGDILVFDEQEYRFLAPNTAATDGGDNVTVIANKDEIGRPDRIKPAIRVVEPGTDPLDDTEAWDVPPVNQARQQNNLGADAQHDTAPFPATSRPGGDAPTPKRLQQKAGGQTDYPISKPKWSSWFVVIPLIILFMLIAFYFAYTAGYTAGHLGSSTK